MTICTATTCEGHAASAEKVQGPTMPTVAAMPVNSERLPTLRVMCLSYSKGWFKVGIKQISGWYRVGLKSESVS